MAKFCCTIRRYFLCGVFNKTGVGGSDGLSMISGLLMLDGGSKVMPEGTRNVLSSGLSSKGSFLTQILSSNWILRSGSIFTIDVSKFRSCFIPNFSAYQSSPFVECDRYELSFRIVGAP